MHNSELHRQHPCTAHVRGAEWQAALAAPRHRRVQGEQNEPCCSHPAASSTSLAAYMSMAPEVVRAVSVTVISRDTSWLMANVNLRQGWGRERKRAASSAPAREAASDRVMLARRSSRDATGASTATAPARRAAAWQRQRQGAAVCNWLQRAVAAAAR